MIVLVSYCIHTQVKSIVVKWVILTQVPSFTCTEGHAWCWVKWLSALCLSLFLFSLQADAPS